MMTCCDVNFPTRPHCSRRYARSIDPQLQTRCLDLMSLLRRPATMRSVLLVDASCEDIEMDARLPCLNQLVQQHLAQVIIKFKADQYVGYDHF